MQKTLYESGFFLEKAYALSRLLEAQISQLPKDSSQKLALGWGWIFESLKIEPPSGSLLNDSSEETKDFCRADAYTLADHLTFEKSYKGSIASFVHFSQIRAKGQLDDLSYTQLSDCVDYLDQNQMADIWPDQISDFYNTLIKRILFFYGISDSRLYRGEGYSSLQLGRFLAKFEHAISLLETHSQFVYGWKDTHKELSSLLSYCGVFHPYSQVFGSNMSIQKVFDFIVRDSAAVGSLHFSIIQIDRLYSDLALRSKSQVDGELSSFIQNLKQTVSQPKKGDLNSFLSLITRQFLEVKNRLNQIYFQEAEGQML